MYRLTAGDQSHNGQAAQPHDHCGVVSNVERDTGPGQAHGLGVARVGPRHKHADEEQNSQIVAHRFC